MTDNENKPKLTLVKGSKGNERRTGTRGTVSGLTEKQELFAQGLSEGLTNAEAYRRAYNASDMQANTIHTEACKMAQTPKIADRVNQLLQEKRQKHTISSLKNNDRVWRNVWRLAEGENIPPSVQQAALALAAKMAGMLTDKLEIENKPADSKTIEAELLERLQRLTG